MSISTLSFNTSTRTSLLKLQSTLSETSQEVNSGRHADIGRTLGRLTGSAISARAQQTTFKEQQTSNLIVSNRLENIDASMATISEGAEALANNLIGAGLSTAYGTIAQQAASGIQQMTAALNANSGQFLFGGDNTDVQPIKTDAAALTARSAATQTSFDAFVFAATGGTDVSQVSAQDMTDYLTTGFTGGTPAATHKFSDLFSDANWAANWSTASNANLASPISKSETIASSATANDRSLRSIASAYTMLSSVDLGSLSEATRTAVTQTAAKQLKSGTDGITAMRADVGTKLKRIESANTELLRQQDIMEATVDSLESVDITEASLRVNALKTQLETAYTVTGKIQSLSLLNYI
jgi:flagellar hook-associated protein 3 FlgL